LYNRTKNPAIKSLQELGSLDEIVTSFLKGIKDEDGNEIPCKDGIIYPHLSPYGTAIGRLSCSKPNMQNQPPAARFIYVPSDPTWCLVEADFSQGENRLTAWYANDQERLERLSQPGFSEHKLNAQIFFGIPMGDVKKDNSPEAPYGKAKKLTHGINYGEGPKKIANNLDMPFAEVRDYIYKWRVANKKTVDWMGITSKKAELDGVLTNVFSRKRWFYTNKVYTESLAFLPASTLADIIHRCTIGLMYERIGWPPERALKVTSVLAPLPQPVRLLLQVHDSLLIECPAILVPEVVRCMKSVMSQPWPQMAGFYLPVEFSVAPPSFSWGYTERYNPPN
jgi:DNA polymerase-1